MQSRSHKSYGVCSAHADSQSMDLAPTAPQLPFDLTCDGLWGRGRSSSVVYSLLMSPPGTTEQFQTQSHTDTPGKTQWVKKKESMAQERDLSGRRWGGDWRGWKVTKSECTQYMCEIVKRQIQLKSWLWKKLPLSANKILKWMYLFPIEVFCPRDFYRIQPTSGTKTVLQFIFRH